MGQVLPPVLLRSLRGALIGVALALVGAAAPADDRVKLPTEVVIGTRILPALESWRYARIPGYEAISSAGDGDTRRFLRDFQLLRQAVAIVWPGDDGAGRMAGTIVVCGRGDQFETFIPASGGEEARFGNGLFLRADRQLAIVFALRPAEIGLGGGTTHVTDPYRSFYTAYFRFLVRQRLGGRAPVWFEEGLVQILSRIGFDRRAIVVGRVAETEGHPRSAAAPAEDGPTTTPGMPAGGFADAIDLPEFPALLQRHELLALPEMFLGPPPDPASTVYWRAQCEAFVHLCLYGRGKVHQKPLLDFVGRLAREPVSEELFRQCFGKGYEAFAVELRGYCEVTAHQYVQFRKARGGEVLPEPPPAELRDASEAEYGRIKGETLRLGGRFAEARGCLVAPYVRGQRDPALLAALGLNELAAGERTRAMEYLEAAFQGGTSNARALVELARLRLDEAAHGGPALSMEKAALVLAPLDAACKARPLIPEIYETMAHVWLACKDRPPRQRLLPLVDGANQLGNAKLAYNAAVVFVKFGYLTEARACVDAGKLIHGGDAALQKRFLELDRTLPLAPAK